MKNFLIKMYRIFDNLSYRNKGQKIFHNPTRSINDKKSDNPFTTLVSTKESFDERTL